MDHVGSTAPQEAPDLRNRAGAPAADPPDSVRCANELLAIVAYVTADDGPLQTSPGGSAGITLWHLRLLQKALERLDVIDGYLRSRWAFLTAGKEHGYLAPQEELDLSGAALAACRATTVVVEALLAERLPTRHEFEAMSDAALRINPALDVLLRAEATGTLAG